MPDSNFFAQLRRPTTLAAAVAAALVMGGCGGSGGSDDASPPTELKTGSVAVLFTDAPSDQFCEIRATITGVDLLGTNGPTNVFSGTQTVNVLAMENFSDFFALDTSVPIGSYEKIRLTLSDLALIECSGDGIEPPGDWEHPRLPGNGKLDLNPRGPIEVIGGEMLVIELDMDMEKSLHLHQTGNGKWQFRPVVFVTVRPDDSNLVRVFGNATNFVGTSFELCPIEPVSTAGQHSMMASTECLDVSTDADTGMFDETGSPAGLSALNPNDPVTAIGFLRLHDDADGDTRQDDLRLDAVVLEYGPQGTFERLRGAVASTPGNNDIFTYNSGGPEPIDVLLQSGTRIFAIGSNEELTSSALQPLTAGEVSGVFTVPPSGELLKSSLVVLDQDTTPVAEVLGATIASIDPAQPNGFDVTVGATTRCITTDTATVYLEITETSSTSETAVITFGDLAEGDEVDVYGTVDPDDASCVLARNVQKYATTL